MAEGLRNLRRRLWLPLFTARTEADRERVLTGIEQEEESSEESKDEGSEDKEEPEEEEEEEEEELEDPKEKFEEGECILFQLLGRYMSRLKWKLHKRWSIPCLWKHDSSCIRWAGRKISFNKETRHLQVQAAIEGFEPFNCLFVLSTRKMTVFCGPFQLDILLVILLDA